MPDAVRSASRTAGALVLLVVALVATGLPLGAVAGSAEAIPATFGDEAVPVAAPAAAETADWAPFIGSPQLWCTMSNPGGGNFCINAGHHSYPALDIGMAAGTTVRAAGPGTVIDLNNTCPSTTSGASPDMSCGAGRGRFVAIQHPDGRVSRYLHLSSVGVSMSQTVARGQVLGASGNSGGASAPHLHYDEQQPYGTAVDPGPMTAIVNGARRSYPTDLGAASWWVTPYGTTLRNDGYAEPVGLGDYSGDGVSDPATYDLATGEWQVQGTASMTLGGAGQLPAPGDFTGTGTAQRATWTPATGVWRVPGQSDVTLGAVGQLPVPADYDGDGVDERATWEPSTGVWRVEGLANATLGGPGQIPVPGDYDGDAAVERATYEPSTGIWRIEGLADATFGGPGQLPVPGDFAGAGVSARATYEPATGTWRVQGLGDVVLGAPGEVPVPADYDGDGTLERATYAVAGGQWRIEGAAGVSLGGPHRVPVSSVTPWATWWWADRAAAPTDLDADLRGDPGAWRDATGQWLRFGQGAVTFGQAGDVPLLGDLDGDGSADRTVFRPDSGIWFTQASGYLPFTVAAPSAVEQPVLADTDGDGVDEPMLFRPTTGRLIRIGGSSSLIGGIGETGDVAVWGDRDADGRDEVGVFRPSTGEWRFPGEAPVVFGQQGDVPVLADMNGDLLAERIVYRPSAGIWFVNIPGWFPVAFGQAGDVPVVVDANGDAKAELGVYRPGAGSYLALGAAPVAVGQAGDLPIPRAGNAAPVPAAAPTGVSAAAGDSSAVVTWTPPEANGGSPVIGYRITMSPGGASQVVGAGTTSTTVTGLANGVTVTAKVAAITVAGSGATSAASAGVTPTASTTVPGPPSGVTAIAGEASATVLWQPPAQTGGAAITGYTITVSPGGATVAAAADATSASVVGLANGTAYTFTVSAANAFGSSSPSAPSNVVTPPGVGGGMHPLTPARVLDTRDGTGSPATPLGPGEERTVQAAGVGGVPADGVSAIVVNVTITGPTAPTHLTVWPTGQARPNASSLNAVAGQTVANLVVATVGAGGRISIFNNSGSAHVVADVVGWIDRDGSGSAFSGLTPSRLLDTRELAGGAGAPFGPGESRSLQVTGVGGVPASGVTAVAVNITLTGPSAPTHLTVWPSGAARPTASNLNAPAGATVPNLVVAAVGAGGQISIFNNAGSAHVVVDVVGYYGTDGGRFRGMTPTRIVDTRSSSLGAPTPLGPGEARDIVVTGVVGIPPAGVSAVVVNVTVTGATAPSHVTVWPAGSARPTASNLNVVPGQTVPNLVMVGVGPSGAISVFNNSGSLHLIVDVVGYLS